MITLVGLGPGDENGLSIGALRSLETASLLHASGEGKLFLRTARHPIVEYLQSSNISFDSLDRIYETSPDFNAVYQSIADIVISSVGDEDPFKHVTFAVPGHPLFAEDSVRRILEQAAYRNMPVQIVSSASFVEAVLTSVGANLGNGCSIRDALTLPLADEIDRNGHRPPGRPDSAINLLLYQVFDQASASHAKLALMQDYPDDWPVQLVRWAGVIGKEDVRTIALHDLDRVPVDYLTSVFVPCLPPEARRPRMPDLIGLMRRLRAPDGCPWDREQSPKTLRKFLIEETYEAVEAIDNDDPELLCEELGDVLLQVVFHAQIASENDDFNIDDVFHGIMAKMIRRHPHVFGAEDFRDSDEVLRNWELIKKAEKQDQEHRKRNSAMDGIPKGLPSLMQAMEVSKRAVKVGFEWGNLADVLAKVDEEVNELKAELSFPNPDTGRVLSELGDLLFTCVQVARWNKVDPEEALRLMIARFEKRFRHMEKAVASVGKQLAGCSPAELDVLWNAAKLDTLEH